MELILDSFLLKAIWHNSSLDSI